MGTLIGNDSEAESGQGNEEAWGPSRTRKGRLGMYVEPSQASETLEVVVSKEV